ncbi:ferredoxin-type protein NapF [Cereibacter sediminicola]|uniref:ferredoxin-type protein NapF n=1 Tax=Cereibacter sediminicola TaxID=2584941 RepID=UPI0011A00FA4|nr:ferredoxin-type protein NapF [Cereibacter sediminicola]
MALNRRSFLSVELTEHPAPIRPPWTREADMARCTGCAACVEACPEAILLMERGLPQVAFGRGECSFCGACAEACPEPVFDLTRPAFAQVAAVGAGCLTLGGVACMACADICPEAAIRLRPRIGGPAVPELAASRCTGCGACVAICPADAVGMQEREAADA